MSCPFLSYKIQYDCSRESTAICNHSDYLSTELAEQLKRLGKTFVPNRECQFVQELDYRQCPLYKSKSK